MATLYFDCFSGASGDMILGALLDLGLPLDGLRAALGSLALEYGDVGAERVSRAGVAATKLRLTEKPEAPDAAAAGHAHKHHHLKHIVAAIRRSSLAPAAQDRAVHLFERLAGAEAAIHDTPIERVHLHEVGALDSIIDIVGAVYAFDWFGIADIVVSPINVGGGTVRCAHGVFPVPAPATARLLAGAPVYGGGTSELLTPTGALLLTDYAREFGPLPPIRLDATGYGAGDRDPKEAPNVLRVLRGERVEGAAPAAGRVVQIECEIDDMNPQIFGPLMDRLTEAGALDVFYAAVQMKKNRPGTLVTIVAPPDRREEITAVLFAQTTTIGVRYQEMRRDTLDREIRSIETPLGAVRVKIASRGGRVLNAAPEFDDCVRIASERGLPIKDVQAAAARAWLESRDTA